MTENDTLEVVLLIIEKNFTYQPFKKIWYRFCIK